MVTCDFCLPLKKFLYFGPNRFSPSSEYFHGLSLKVSPDLSRMESAPAFQCMKSTTKWPYIHSGAHYKVIFLCKISQPKRNQRAVFAALLFPRLFTVLSALFPHMIVVIFRLAFATKLLLNFDSIMRIKCYISESYHTFSSRRN